MKKYEKKQDVSWIMPHCQVLLIVIVTAIILIYKEFLKNSNMSNMLLRDSFVKL